MGQNQRCTIAIDEVKIAKVFLNLFKSTELESRFLLKCTTLHDCHGLILNDDCKPIEIATEIQV